MNISLTKSEVATIKQVIKSQIDCEKDAVQMFPENADYFKQLIKDWKSIQKKLRGIKC